MVAIRRGVYEIRIRKSWCKACGLCIAWCPQKVLVPDDENYPVAVRKDNCINCKLCEWHCPDFAIEIIPPELEVVDVNAFIHAW